jgi:hypothetical protein
VALTETRVVATSLDGKLYLADFATGIVAPLATGLEHAVSCLHYVPDGGLVIGSEGGELCIISNAELNVLGTNS